MQNLLSLKKYFLRYKSKLLLGIIFILVSNVLNAYLPLLLKDSINELQKKTTGTVLLRYGLLIVGISIVAGIFRYLIRQTIIVVSREIEFDLRGDFWNHIQKLPLRYFQNNSTGNIMSLATNDINSVRSFIGPAVMYSVDTIVTLVFVVTILFSMNFELTVYALLPLPFISIGVFAIGKLVHAKYIKIQEDFGSDLSFPLVDRGEDSVILSGQAGIKSCNGDQFPTEFFGGFVVERVEQGESSSVHQAGVLRVMIHLAAWTDFTRKGIPSGGWTLTPFWMDRGRTSSLRKVS